MPLHPIFLLVLLGGCVLRGWEPHCAEDVGTLDGTGGPVVWEDGWDGEGCVPRPSVEGPARYLVFSTETLGVLVVQMTFSDEDLEALAEQDRLSKEDHRRRLKLLRIDESTDDRTMDFDSVGFDVRTGTHHLLYYIDGLEAGTYAMETVPILAGRDVFAFTVFFRTDRQRTDEVVDIVDTFCVEGSRILQRPVDVGDIDIVFSPGTDVVCWVSSEEEEEKGDVRRKIDLGAAGWEIRSPYQREQTLLHELGHCYLGRGDDNGRTEDGRRTSIMGDLIIGSGYRDYREEYIEELFDVRRFGRWRTGLLSE